MDRPAVRPNTRRYVIAVGCLAWLVGCEGRPELPTGPGALEDGIVIYEDVNFTGPSAHISQDVHDLSDFDGPCEKSDDSVDSSGTINSWDDCISSVRVAPGWRAILYRADDFDEDHFELSADHPDFSVIPGPCRKDSFNDCVSSIRVFAP